VYVVLAGLSALLYGSGDFCGGLAARRRPLAAVLTISQSAGLVAAVAALVLLRQPFPAMSDIAWGIAGGIAGTAGLAALYQALASTLVAVASPVAAVTGAVVPVFLGLAAGEHPANLAWAGIALAVPAIALLAGGPAGSARPGLVRRAALMGVAAGIGFGLFFFCISRTSHSSGLWPLAAARLVTLLLVAGFAAATRAPLAPFSADLAPALLAGVLDMSANIAFLLASRAGLLSVTAVITSLYPGPTVILAMIFFREKLTVTRALGLVLAVAGVACLSA